MVNTYNRFQPWKKNKGRSNKSKKIVTTILSDQSESSTKTPVLNQSIPEVDDDLLKILNMCSDINNSSKLNKSKKKQTIKKVEPIIIGDITNEDDLIKNILNIISDINNDEKELTKSIDKRKEQKMHIAKLSCNMQSPFLSNNTSLNFPKIFSINNGSINLNNLLNMDKQQIKPNDEIIDNSLLLDPTKEYNELDVSINNLTDLINLGKLYLDDINHNYPINLKRLHDLIPTLERLNNVIGMESVKTNIINQIVYFMSGIDLNQDMLHTVITGPPGIGKTMLGHIIGDIYYNLGVIKGSDNKKEKYAFKIAKRVDLIGEYMGHTAIKTQRIIDEAQNGVLFIDEAYSLGNEEKKDIYSKECIDTLNQNLTERKNNFICIIAGYDEAINKCFFSVNEGLKRRFPFKYNIDKYTPVELNQIFMTMIKEKNWMIDPKMSLDDMTDFMKENYKYFPHFGGDIETFFFNVRVVHAMRTLGKLPKNKKYISLVDLKNGLAMFIKCKDTIKEYSCQFMYL